MCHTEQKGTTIQRCLILVEWITLSMISNFLLKAIGELYHQAQDGNPIVFQIIVSYL